MPNSADYFWSFLWVERNFTFIIQINIEKYVISVIAPNRRHYTFLKLVWLEFLWLLVLFFYTLCNSIIRSLRNNPFSTGPCSTLSAILKYFRQASCKQSSPLPLVCYQVANKNNLRAPLNLSHRWGHLDKERACQWDLAVTSIAHLYQHLMLSPTHMPHHPMLSWISSRLTNQESLAFFYFIFFW